MTIKLNKLLIFLLFIFVFVPMIRNVSADTLVLKDGRKISCAEIWDENGIVKCSAYGAVVGYPSADVKTIIDDQPDHIKETNKTNGFSFDVWHSGMSVQDVVNTSEKHDIPLHTVGIIAANKHFNFEILRKYIHTATEFSYRDTLMGKPALVTLYFTPTSKLLVKLKVHLNSVEINRDTPYPKEIEAMLTAKYGKPSRPIIRGLFKDTASWNVKNTYTVLMETGSMRVDIIYTDLRLQAINVLELSKIQAKKRNQYHSEDASKF